MKTHILLLSALCCALILPATLGASNVGKRYPSEMRTMTDRVTGSKLTVLTASNFSDGKPYQTHDTWTADGNWIIFRSTRDGGKNGQIFVVSEITGDIIQLTDDPATNTGSINLSRKEMKLFYTRGGQRRQPPGSTETPPPAKPTEVIELNIGSLIADSMAGELKTPETYERTIVTLPTDVRDGGGLALDADETRLYWGVNYTKPDVAKQQAQASAARTAKGERQIDSSNTDPKADREANRKRFEEAGKGNCAIRQIDIATGKITKVIDIPFRLGHLQANPWTPGEIIYCHETTGDVPPPSNRIWVCNADGSNNRPAYAELPDEWITHETVAGPDELLFNNMGHLPYLREHGTGIAVVNLRNKQMKILGQVEEDMGNGQLGGFWHCNGSPDGKWAVGDTFKGSVYAINRETGKRTMLTTGHMMRPDHSHPIVSKDSKRVLIQSGMLTAGKALNLMVVALPEE